MKIRLSTWAKQEGVHYKTAQRWYYAGKMPVQTEKTPTGRIMVVLAEKSLNSPVTIYARVSSSDQKSDLVRQVERLQLFASAKGWEVAEVVTEIGSGLNGKRKKLLRILKDQNRCRVLVEHRDRLARFGVEYLSAALEAQGREIIIAEQGEQKLDLVQDFIDVVTSMCARIYGRRAAKNRAKRALAAAAEGKIK
jgi:putative resolvase